MTWVGKILVMINFALSLVMVAWAIGVYAQTTNYHNEKPPASPTDPPLGELAKRRERIAAKQGGGGLWLSVVTAEARWKLAAPELRFFEGQRPANRQWFDAQLTDLGAGPNLVKDVVYKDGRVVIADPNVPYRPLMKDAQDKAGKPLRAMAVYVKEQADVYNQVKDTMDDLVKATKEDTDLTTRIGGPKGLREQLAAEQEKYKHVAAEVEYLKPLLINTQVESELLNKRRRSLEARVKELEQAPPSRAGRNGN